jgi:hypothetical protein
MNTSVITSPSPIQLTLYENANSICWQICRHGSNLPPSQVSHHLGCLATLDALVDSTTHTTKLIRRDTSAYSPKYSRQRAPSIHRAAPVLNREQWKTTGTEWIKHQQALTIYEYGPHPLLGDGILDHQFFWHLQDIHRRFSMNDGHM